LVHPGARPGAVNEADEYRPGWQIELDLGYIWQPRMDLSLSLQVNTVRKDRDASPEAEPETPGTGPCR